MNYLKKLLWITLASAALAQPALHPDSLAFSSLKWEIPDGNAYRSVIKGIPTYFAQEKLPIFTLQLSFKAGELYGQGENGTAQLYRSLLRTGGTKTYVPSQLDSILDLYAIRLSVSGDESKTVVTVSGLSDQFDRAVTILAELLAAPRFDEKRLARDKSILKEKIGHRFDNPGPVMMTAWKKLLYPESKQASLLSTESVDKVSAADLKQFHQQMVSYAPVIAACAGSISKKQLDGAIKKLFPSTRTAKEPVVIVPDLNPTHTLVIVQKPINQAYIITGQAGLKRPDDRYYALTIFNEILGAGGFNSRLVTKVRSDAGLTYSISSSVESNYRYNGSISASLFTKSESVNHALGLTVETIKNTLAETLTDEEINEKRYSFIASLPSSFRSGSDIVSTYQENELLGRPMDHYRNYPKVLEEITTDQVMKTARATIKPESFVTMIVGDTTELFKAPAWNGVNISTMNPLILTEESLIDFNVK